MSLPSGADHFPNHGADRELIIEQWLDRVLPAAERQRSFASDDASFRRYFRVAFADRRVIVMDAPPMLEDSRPFVRLAAAFRQVGMRTPEIFAIDLSAGLLLLEDFGSMTLFDALDSTEFQVDERLDYAVDRLAELSRRSGKFSVCVPAYDEAAVRRELGLFPTWFVERHLGTQLPAQVWTDACRFLVERWQRMPTAIVHRDYHSRNLMVLPGVALGVIDFQDACLGPAAYDLVSLLKDCYVRWSDETCERLLARYHAGAALPSDYDLTGLRRDVELCGIQRHLKVAGIFSRLYYRDGKERYLHDLPRVIDYLRRALPAFSELERLLDCLPDDATLSALSPCAR
ncbi:MAG: phosphotransferase [Pseudomonadota bacterium]